MLTLHLVSHTHWDREWYLPFQVFRLKLVHLVDKLLEILDTDPDYRYFMLDGQTIVLDDYLELRPEREGDLRRYIQQGRVLIGPWHILPDEFLVSPEATIRNLLQGERTARRFGSKMQVGYIPDPFGHIGQMPQILRGFGIETAAFRRGLSNEPCELYWQAADGSKVFTIYLRDSYDNAALLPVSRPDQFVEQVRRLRDSLAPHSAAPCVLLMQGTDHMEPHPQTAATLAAARERLDGDMLVHSTLPQYIQQAHEHLQAHGLEIPTLCGELRDPQRHHLLPGVLSTRMWIKQRNHASEELLERWAEPFSTWAAVAAPQQDSLSGERLEYPAGILRAAWRRLMENHPHDSICGCSIDQVHREMQPRFDQVDQVAGEVLRHSLSAIAGRVDTSAAPAGARRALVVFNPLTGPRNGLVTLDLTIPAGIDEFELVDEGGNVAPFSIMRREQRELMRLPLERGDLLQMMSGIHDGEIGGLRFQEIAFLRRDSTVVIEAVVSEHEPPDREAVAEGTTAMQAYLQDESIRDFLVILRKVTLAQVRLLATDVPGFGYKTYWLRGLQAEPVPADPGSSVLENESLKLSFDPSSVTFTLMDKRTGKEYSHLNRFEDGGDAGDEYNYSPPRNDLLASPAQADVVSVTHEKLPERQTLEVRLALPVPVSLTPDRQGRTDKRCDLQIVTRASLSAGVPRVDFHTWVENPAFDHRLRVHFPLPFRANWADYDGHFEIVRRRVGLPEFDAGWVEQPRPEVPQRAFTCLSDGSTGLMLANRGLPEIAVQDNSQGNSEMALTLLRCVGWLSRADFPTRKGHAGPMLETPEAQMIGSHDFEYSLIPHAGGWREGFVQAYAFNSPMRALAVPLQPGELPSMLSFIQVEPDEFVISAVKAPEDGSEGWILRGYNISAEALDVRIRPWRRFERVSLLNMAEQPLAWLPVEPDGSIRLNVKKHRVETLMLSG